MGGGKGRARARDQLVKVYSRPVDAMIANKTRSKKEALTYAEIAQLVHVLHFLSSPRSSQKCLSPTLTLEPPPLLCV